jgi:hypothetical protein
MSRSTAGRFTSLITLLAAVVLVAGFIPAVAEAKQAPPEPKKVKKVKKVKGPPVQVRRTSKGGLEYTNVQRRRQDGQAVPAKAASADDLPSEGPEGQADVEEVFRPLPNPVCNRPGHAMLESGIPDLPEPEPGACDPPQQDEQTVAGSIDPAERAAIIRQAVQHLLVEPGEVGVLPGRALTGLETFFWVEDVEPRITPPDEGPFGMEIRAWPVGYRWEFGDGRSMSSNGPGNPQAPRSSEISHVYQRGGRLEARVVVTWEGSASSDAGTQAVPGPFTTTASVPVQVDQIRARLVG